MNILCIEITLIPCSTSTLARQSSESQDLSHWSVHTVGALWLDLLANVFGFYVALRSATPPQNHVRRNILCAGFLPRIETVHTADTICSRHQCVASCRDRGRVAPQRCLNSETLRALTDFLQSAEKRRIHTRWHARRHELGYPTSRSQMQYSLLI